MISKPAEEKVNKVLSILDEDDYLKLGKMAARAYVTGNLERNHPELEIRKLDVSEAFIALDAEIVRILKSKKERWVFPLMSFAELRKLKRTEYVKAGKESITIKGFYHIDLDGCKSIKGILKWVRHLSEKGGWVTTDVIYQFINVATRAHGINLYGENSAGKEAVQSDQ